MPEQERRDSAAGHLVRVARGGFAFLGGVFTVVTIVALVQHKSHHTIWAYVAAALAAFLLTAISEILRVHRSEGALRDVIKELTDQRKATLWAAAHAIDSELRSDLARVRHAQETGQFWPPMAVLSDAAWRAHEHELLELGATEPNVHEAWKAGERAYNAFQALNHSIQADASKPPEVPTATTIDGLVAGAITAAEAAQQALSRVVPELVP